MEVDWKVVGLPVGGYTSEDEFTKDPPVLHETSILLIQLDLFQRTIVNANLKDTGEETPCRVRHIHAVIVLEFAII
jgi:hypothetical protein